MSCIPAMHAGGGKFYGSYFYWVHAPADPLPVEDMYYRRKSNPQNPHWVTVRGTSKLEGYHPHLARALPGTGYSPDTAGGIFALFNMQWNLKRGVENKGDPDTGTVEPWLQNNLAQLSKALQLSADTFQTVSIPASTPELFGVEYVPDTLDKEAAHEAEQQGRAELEAELGEEDEALLAAAALDAMRQLGRPYCILPQLSPSHMCIYPYGCALLTMDNSEQCSFADGSSPAVPAGRLPKEVQPPGQRVDVTASPSAPPHHAPAKQAGRRLPASLQRGSMRLPSASGAPGNLRAIIMMSQ